MSFLTTFTIKHSICLKILLMWINAQWCQHVEKVSGPENTSEHPNLSEVCFLALFLWL